MAPDMPMQVSAQVADQVRALAAAGGLSPFACKNSAVIRRDVTQRDLDVAGAGQAMGEDRRLEGDDGRTTGEGFLDRGGDPQGGVRGHVGSFHLGCR